MPTGAVSRTLLRPWKRALVPGLGLWVCGAWGGFGCGARTSILEPDAYAAGGASAGSSLGGRGSPGRGDTLLAADEACRRHCDVVSQQCRGQLLDGDCTTRCRESLNQSGGVCRSLGVALLECLTPLLQPTDMTCDEILSSAGSSCEEQLFSLGQCRAASGHGGATAPRPATPGGTGPAIPAPRGTREGALFVANSLGWIEASRLERRVDAGERAHQQR